uniref:Uncharacterized protein n=1 Tax=Anguilla anguilla TaxID=7936 RepID=A0A0E9T8T1_ANGAN
MLQPVAPQLNSPTFSFSHPLRASDYLTVKPGLYIRIGHLPVTVKLDHARSQLSVWHVGINRPSFHYAS